jgi:hypothetical protein
MFKLIDNVLRELGRERTSVFQLNNGVTNDNHRDKVTPVLSLYHYM